jgi:hypothetical protein
MTTPDPRPVTPDDELAALRRSARILANIVARNHQAMEAARIEMRQNGPHAAMQWILNSLPDVWDDPETEWDGRESAQAWFDRTESFYRAAESAADARLADDPSRVEPASLGQSGERSGAVPVLPVGADFDREAEYWHRRWLFAWERLDEAGGRAISQHVRIMELEGKLAEVRAVLLEGGQDAGTVRRRALAIIGSEEGSRKPAATPEQMLREFHASKAIHGGLMPSGPTSAIPKWVRDLRMALLTEEVRELYDAAMADDIVKIADGIADIAYVVIGTAVAYGIPFDAVFAEVHRSNMTKVNTPEEGKLVKGPGYEPPDIAGILAITGTEPEDRSDEGEPRDA